MAEKTLRVRARLARDGEIGPPKVQNYERLEAGVNSFIGMKFQKLDESSGQYGYVVQDEIVEIPARAEYVKALRDGDLLPADEATAQMAGIETTSNQKDESQ